MKTIPAKPAWAKALLSIVVTVLPVACFAGDVSQAAPAAKAKSEQPTCDLVVYGDSSGAVVAAISAKREGRSVVFVNPTSFPGGMSASGLGATDFLGKRATFGGIASEFYDAIAAAYGTKYIRSFELHVAKLFFEKMLADVGEGELLVVQNCLHVLQHAFGLGLDVAGEEVASGRFKQNLAGAKPGYFTNFWRSAGL